MSNNLPTEGERIRAARDRLYEALGTSSAAEGEVVRYLTRALPIDAAELLAGMVERELKRARAEGYDKGHFEGMEQLADAQAAAAAPARVAVQYLDKLPASVPPGRVLVHNQVRPTRALGTRGFRAWLQPPEPDKLQVCGCGWADELGEHYRVRIEGGGDR